MEYFDAITSKPETINLPAQCNVFQQYFSYSCLYAQALYLIAGTSFSRQCFLRMDAFLVGSLLIQ
jgi:hypothetical protein